MWSDGCNAWLHGSVGIACSTLECVESSSRASTPGLRPAGCKGRDIYTAAPPLTRREEKMQAPMGYGVGLGGPAPPADLPTSYAENGAAALLNPEAAACKAEGP